MRFLADESLDYAAVRALRAAGHDVVAIAEVARRLPDPEVLAFAAREQRILLTEDKDFGTLVFAQGFDGVGVVLMRFPASDRALLAPSVLEAIERLADRLSTSFVVIEPGRARIRS